MKKGGVREVNSFISVDSPKNPSVANGKNRRSTIIGSSTAARSTSDVTKTKLSMTTSENALRPGRSSQDVAGKQTSKSRAGLVPKAENESKSFDTSVPFSRTKKSHENFQKAELPSFKNKTSTTRTLNSAIKLTDSVKDKKNDRKAVSRYTANTMDNVHKQKQDILKTKAIESTSRRNSILSMTTEKTAVKQPTIISTKQNTSHEIFANKEVIDADFEYEYEDDFEDYESDFESYSESNDSPEEMDSTLNVANQKLLVEEEKKMDSGSYDLTYHQQALKQKKHLDVIKEALQKENIAIQQSVCFPSSASRISQLDILPLPMQEVNYKESDHLLKFDDKIVRNISTVEKKHPRSEISYKIKARGEKLLQMITLDTMQYTLHEMTPMPYDLFMKIYAHKNTTQAYTQTNEDNLSSETQTEEIQTNIKWTQHPPRITKDMLTENVNLHQILSGVGTEKNESISTSAPVFSIQKLQNFMKTVGEEMIALLEDELYEVEINSTDISEQNVTEISSCISCIKCSLTTLLKDLSVSSMCYDPYNSSKLLTTHAMNASDNTSGSVRYSFLCIWNIQQPSKPKMVLKSYGKISCSCFAGTNSPYVIAGHDDGSVCVWDIREDSLCTTINLMCEYADIVLRTPSHKTENTGHFSEVVSADTIKLNSENEDYFNEPKYAMVCTVEKQNVIIIWTISRSLSKMTDSAAAPWSKIKFFINQIINIAQLFSKEIFHTTELKVLNENCILIGTSAEFVFRCSIYGKQCKKYRKSNWDDSNAKKLSVTCIEVCPYNRDYFAVGFSNTDICLYNAQYTEPLCELDNYSSQFNSIIAVQWLWSKQDYVLTLDCHSTLNIYRFQSDCYTLARRVKTNNMRSVIVSPFKSDQKGKIHLAFLTNNEIQIHKLIAEFEDLHY